MTCSIYGTDRLSEPMMTSIWLDSQEQTVYGNKKTQSVEFQRKYKTFYSTKCTCKFCLKNFTLSRSQWVKGLMDHSVDQEVNELIGSAGLIPINPILIFVMPWNPNKIIPVAENKFHWKQGSLCVCAYQLRDDITLWHCLLLAGWYAQNDPC